MEIIKKQYLSTSDVRSMCIAENLFTRGSNERYGYMLDIVRNLEQDTEISTASLHHIAHYIRIYSDCEAWVRKTGLELSDFEAHIMYCLYERVTTTFEIIE